LQDAINAHVVNGTHFSEREMLRLFKGVCEAIRAMHMYKPTSASKPAVKPANAPTPHAEEDGDDDDRFPQPEGDNEGGYSYDNAVNVPLVSKRRVEFEGDVVFDGDEETAHVAEGDGNSEVVPYAHRDLKPA